MFDAAETATRGVARELPWQDPMAGFLAFADAPHVAFLHSAGAPGPRSRYSYLCIDPVEMLGGATLGDLARALAGHAFGRWHAPVPFAGGAVGFFGYDAAASLDNADAPTRQLAGIPQTQFGIYDLLFAWDHEAQKCWLINASGDQPERVSAALARLRRGGAAKAVPPLRWREDVPRALHLARVERALKYIRAGDIYQANVTASFSAPRPFGVRAADIFASLQAENPAPFSAFIGCGDGNGIASVSPERFLRVGVDGGVEARPIKGTRPRGITPDEDAEQASLLLASEKDRAENLMIVDLLRNDIGRVAQTGSVAVPALNTLESFARVHHLVSSVTGRLLDGKSAIDLLQAALPGGSITGAPKIRAMQIISELEGTGRGPYCGTALWLGFDGAMDSNILIRTVTIAADLVVAQAGGGIVADSDPAAEWDEVMVKVSPLLLALGEITQQDKVGGARRPAKPPSL